MTICNVGYQCKSNKVNCSVLLLIAATFLRCFAVTAATKGTRICLWSKKFDFKTQGTIYRDEIYNPQALSGALTSLKPHSSGPLGYKFHRSLCLEAYNYYVVPFLHLCRKHSFDWRIDHLRRTSRSVYKRPVGYSV